MTAAHQRAYARPAGQNDDGEMSSDQEGLTVREHYAGLVYTALLAHAGPRWRPGHSPDHYESLAREAVQAADALIRALGEPAPAQRPE